MAKLIISEEQYKKIKRMIIESQLLSEQTKDEIMQVQQKLIDCFKADLGKSGPKKNGVDGICGNKTKTAIEQYTSYRFSTGTEGTEGTSGTQGTAGTSGTQGTSGKVEDLGVDLIGGSDLTIA